MKFILQSENGEINDVEVFNFLQLLKRRKYCHEYIIVELEDICNGLYSQYYPIGDLRYVRKWLDFYYNIPDMKPIEVPEILRKEKYLGRTYDIVSLDQLDLNGYKFLKDISKLKSFSYIGDLSFLDKSDKNVFKSNLYLISNYVNIISEYRVFIWDLEIKAIQHYDGDVRIFPDVSLIQEMVNLYYTEVNRPRAYTMDVAVLNNMRTVIIEVHPVTSVGTYGYYDEDLFYMYREGIDYYKTEKNKMV